MDRSQLLNGLTPDTSVSQQMLSELKEVYSRLVERSCRNENWTERDQLDFELLHVIIRRHESREAA